MRKHGNDKKFNETIEAMIRTLAPGAIALNQSRFDCEAFCYYPRIFGMDRDYFKIYRVTAFIREGHCGEIDYSPSYASHEETYRTLKYQRAELPNDVLKSIYKRIPRQWLLVENRGGGMHHVTSIYRGSAFWEVTDRDGRAVGIFKSNDELNLVLKEIQRREGTAPDAEWKRFVDEVRDACALLGPEPDDEPQK